MEKKYNRLQSENKDLHKCIGDKLLLEEEVEHLKTRLANNEKLSEEVVHSNAKIPYIEQELAAYKAVASDHCSDAVSPSHLRSRIEEILRKDLLLVGENGSLRIERDSIAGQVDDLKKVQCGQNIAVIYVADPKKNIFFSFTANCHTHEVRK